MARTTWQKGIPLEKTLQERLRDLVSTKGEKVTAELVGVGVASIVRAAAGLGLRRGTARLIEMTLANSAERAA